MMKFEVPVSLSLSLHRSRGAAGYPMNGNGGRGAAGYPTKGNGDARAAGGRQAAAEQNIHPPRMKLPLIRSLSSCSFSVVESMDGKSFFGSYIIGGSSNLSKNGRLEEARSIPEDICGKHFLFDTKCKGDQLYEFRDERTRTLIPPLPRDYHVHRSDHPKRLSLPKEFAHRHTVQSFTLGSYEVYDLNTSPAILIPSALVLNGRNTSSVDNCKFSRPKVNSRTCNLLTVRDDQKSQSYPDPMVGANHSFIQRISDLSCLEGETARKEKLKKMRKTRKQDS